jgi:hypothetical protein
VTLDTPFGTAVLVSLRHAGGLTSYIGHVGVTTDYETSEIVVESADVVGEIGVTSKVLPTHLGCRGRGSGCVGCSGRGRNIGDRSWTSSITETPGGDSVGTTAHFGWIPLTWGVAVDGGLDFVVSVESIRAVAFTIVFCTGKFEADAFAGSLTCGVGHGIAATGNLISDSLSEYSSAVIQILVAPECGPLVGSSCRRWNIVRGGSGTILVRREIGPEQGQTYVVAGTGVVLVVGAGGSK